MAQKPELLEQSIYYIRLETIASLFSTLLKYNLLIIMLLGMSRKIIILAVVQVVLTMLFDSIFLGQFAFSFNLGVNGIAISNIITSLLLLTITSTSLINHFSFNIKNMSFGWLKEWFKVGKYSGLESLIRNIAFTLMIVRMMNIISAQGTYWVANNFIWCFMLIPVIALGQVIKRNVAQNFDGYKRNQKQYIKITGYIIVVWLLSIPLWEPFLKKVMNVQHYEPVLWLIKF